MTTLIVKFKTLGPLTAAQMQLAMFKIGVRLVNQSRSNMHWRAPTGALSESIHAIYSPLEVLVGSDLPYAWRREKGFTGMTDVLGRYYRYDPGQYYLTRALLSTVPYGEKVMLQALWTALGARPG